MTPLVVDTTSDEFVQEMFGDKEVRWYQRAAINQLVISLNNKLVRILIVQPTGSGKTITIACGLSDPEVRKALGVDCDRPLRVLFVSHLHRLLTQAESTFIAESNVELITQSAFSEISEETIKNGWDVCVIDEAHHEAMSSIQYMLDTLGNHPIIGLTATPDRADGCIIKFQEIICPISREQAVAEGWLAPTRIHSFVDCSSQNKVEILTEILTNYGHEMGQTMVFVKTKKEVTLLSNIITALGYRSVPILTQSKKELDIVLSQFSAGEIQFLVNCNKISEGVDVKGCTDVLLGRQFGSYPQLNQVIGRAARPDSDCNVWELINPLNGRNLDTTVVVGTPEFHRLVSKEKGSWKERVFDYVTRTGDSRILGIADGIRIRH